MPRTPSPGPGGSTPRFLTLADVAEVLATSVAQVRALVYAEAAAKPDSDHRERSGH
jgi:hypothetical protein